MNNAYIKNLLSINKKAFQFLHDVEGFDFENPYFITQQPGKFTTNIETDQETGRGKQRRLYKRDSRTAETH